MEWWDSLYLNEGLFVNLIRPCPHDADAIMYRLCDNGRRHSLYAVNPLLSNTVSEMGEVIVLGKLLLYTLNCTCVYQIHCTDKWLKALKKNQQILKFLS
jgi:hypothetical protein